MKIIFLIFIMDNINKSNNIKKVWEILKFILFIFKKHFVNIIWNNGSIFRQTDWRKKSNQWRKFINWMGCLLNARLEMWTRRCPHYGRSRSTKWQKRYAFLCVWRPWRKGSRLICGKVIQENIYGLSRFQKR